MTRRSFRGVSVNVDVDVDLGEIDERDLLAEMKVRGLDGLAVDLDRLRSTLRREDYRAALYCIEKALPSEFSGFSDSIARHLAPERV